MSNDPEVLAEDTERLELILGGHIFFQTLRSAIALDLFTVLVRNPGASLESLCESVAIEEQPMRILLLGCTALRLIEKRGEGYYNSPVSTALLSRDSGRNIIANVEFAHRLVYRPMFHMYDAMRANRNIGLDEFSGPGDTLYERLSHEPELERVFHEGLQSTSALNVEQLLDHFDFSSVRHVLDVGGGNGTALCAVASRHAGLCGTILETASVCSLADQQIAAAGMSDRVGTRAGDSFSDSFPTGADCILFMHFMTIWSPQSNLELLRKSYAVLPPGGSVVIFDGAQSNDRTGPLRAARWCPYFWFFRRARACFTQAMSMRIG